EAALRVVEHDQVEAALVPGLARQQQRVPDAHGGARQIGAQARLEARVDLPGLERGHAARVGGGLPVPLAREELQGAQPLQLHAPPPQLRADAPHRLATHAPARYASARRPVNALAGWPGRGLSRTIPSGLQSTLPFLAGC